MRRKYSEEYKIVVFKEFLSRKQTIDSFCKKRKIYSSMIVQQDPSELINLTNVEKIKDHEETASIILYFDR